MEARTAAKDTAAAVSAVGGHFMLDGNTYQRGAELGFQGLDFYTTGRGGVLGDVDADVVAAAFTFFEPGHVRAQWELGCSVLPARQAAAEFGACCAAWAEDRVPDELDAERLSRLLDQAVAGARPACAPIFAAFRALDVPAAPKAHAVHQMNALRELRNGLHGAAVIASGLTPLQAVSLRSPAMAPLFGWPDVTDVDGLAPQWDAAEAATDEAMAHAFEPLTDGERAELVALIGQLHAATQG
ncbi:MAG: hypothetical protein Q8K58_06710 [Acidimicrobiales bacterium]|nr:hypothetical protein [Acidimicrobiales bacterium]